MSVSSKTLFRLLFLLALPLVFAGFYRIFGHALVEAAYKGRLFFFSKVISGASVHPLSFYLAYADHRFVQGFTALVIFNSLLALGWWAPFFHSEKFYAFVFGLFLCAVLMALLEMIAGWGFPKQAVVKTLNPRDFKTQDARGLVSAKPGVYEASSRLSGMNQTLYQVKYTIDTNGLRATPVPRAEGRDRFILFFVDSFAFGEGVGDDQTLPAHIGRSAAHYHPYNYGYPGSSPFDLLAKLQFWDLKTQISEPNGILIYIFIDNHIWRMAGGLQTIYYSSNRAYYEQDPRGEWHYRGTPRDARPWRTRFYEWLGQRNLVRRLHFNLPLKLRPRDFERTAAVIKKAQDAFYQKYPKGKFYVLIYPNSEYGPALKLLLQTQGVSCLDYTRLFDSRDPRYTIDPGKDEHPTDLAYGQLAQALVQDLHLD